jgi:hypothetical protein
MTMIDPDIACLASADLDSAHQRTHRLRFATLCLISDFDIPDLPRGNNDDPIDLTIRRGIGPMPPLVTMHEACVSTERSVDHVFEVKHLGHCRVGSDYIELWTQPGATDALIEHALADHAIPRWLGRRGDLVFHGTCVEVDGLAIGIVATTGTGKSTLSNALVASGGRWLADDCLWVHVDGDTGWCQPTFAGTRLLPDSREFLGITGCPMHEQIKKQRLSGPHLGAAIQLALIVHLVRSENTDQPTVQSLSMHDAMAAVLTHWYAVPNGQSAQLLRGLGSLLRAVTVAELHVPHGFEHLEATVAVLRQRLSESSLVQQPQGGETHEAIHRTDR